MSGPVDYVARHVRGLKSGQRNVLMVVAKYGGPDGRGCRLSQSAIGELVELCREQVCRHMARLMADKILAREGRRYVILGVVEHDLEIELCDHPHCRREVAARWGRRSPRVFRGSQMAAGGLTVAGPDDDALQGALAALDASRAVPGPVGRAARQHLRAV